MSLMDSLKSSFEASFKAREAFDAPYTHWLLRDVLAPVGAVDDLAALPLPTFEVGAESGAREVHNDDRQYFDQPNIEQHDVCRAFAEVFQDGAIVDLLQRELGADLAGTSLRIEYAQDTDGFWLKPHTDIGVKRFTMLYYLADPASQEDLGTDIYADADTHAGRAPFERNSALVFVPSDKTWHGFERRRINGVRKSIIVNYVTQEWRAREQLAFPDQPVLAG